MSSPMLDLTADELREGLTSCLHVPRWVDEVTAGGPYRSMADLLEAARQAATPLSAEEIDSGLADHPRIGERASGSGAAQRLSRSEQSSSASDDPALAAALAAGNAAYEEKFGRIFLIRAAGRSRSEILAELNRRLTLDPDAEQRVVGAELRDIALLRIPQVFSHVDHHSGFDEADAAR